MIITMGQAATPDAIHRNGKDAILEIDYKGMLLIKSKIPTSRSIYIHSAKY